MVDIRWLDPVRQLFDELSRKEQEPILQRLELLRLFPDMYPVRRRGHFRGHRYFVAGHWLVYYRHRGDSVYVRALWPARIPS